jgi:hypothetical protein
MDSDLKLIANLIDFTESKGFKIINKTDNFEIKKSMEELKKDPELIIYINRTAETSNFFKLFLLNDETMCIFFNRDNFCCFGTGENYDTCIKHLNKLLSNKYICYDCKVVPEIFSACEKCACTICGICASKYVDKEKSEVFKFKELSTSEVFKFKELSTSEVICPSCKHINQVKIITKK